MTDEEKDRELARKILGDASEMKLPDDFVVSYTPDINRLVEPLMEGCVLIGYCGNCGSYPEYSIKNAIKLSELANFELPPFEELKNYFARVNACGICINLRTPKESRPVVSFEKFR